MSSLNEELGDEPEELPKWMRYMPRNKIIPKSTHQPLVCPDYPIDQPTMPEKNAGIAQTTCTTAQIQTSSQQEQGSQRQQKSQQYPHQGNTSLRKRKIVILKRSCNSFGPTSTHAISVESKISEQKRKRKEYFAEEEKVTISDISNHDNLLSNPKFEPTHFCPSSREANLQQNLTELNSNAGNNNVETTGRKVRQRLDRSVNMSEAAELFSIVQLK